MANRYINFGNIDDVFQKMTCIHRGDPKYNESEKTFGNESRVLMQPLIALLFNTHGTSTGTF
jgi:hypothetical protein